MVYLFLLELLIHRLGDPKCVVSGISGCSDMFVSIRHFIVSVRRTGTFLALYNAKKAEKLLKSWQMGTNLRVLIKSFPMQGLASALLS